MGVATTNATGMLGGNGGNGAQGCVLLYF
jgi:hypothetical protein